MVTRTVACSVGEVRSMPMERRFLEGTRTSGAGASPVRRTIVFAATAPVHERRWRAR